MFGAIVGIAFLAALAVLGVASIRRILLGWRAGKRVDIAAVLGLLAVLLVLLAICLTLLAPTFPSSYEEAVPTL